MRLCFPWLNDYGIRSKSLHRLGMNVTRETMPVKDHRSSESNLIIFRLLKENQGEFGRVHSYKW